MSRSPDSIAARRSFLRGLVSIALAAADPESAVARSVTALRSRDPDPFPWVLAVGKAARAMARGAKQGDPRAVGLIVGPREADPTEALEGFDVVEGDHPIPGTGSAASGQAVLSGLLSLPPGARVLCLFSGGASSLCEMPVGGVPFADLQAMTSILLGSGLPIEVINAARGAVSALKAGRMRLLLEADGRKHDTLVVSDVPSDDPTVIASGPMDAPGNAARTRLSELQASPAFAALPASVKKAMASYEPLPSGGRPSRVILSGRTVANVLSKVAAAEGLSVDVRGPLRGEASRVGRELATIELNADCTVWFGETTVTLGSGEERGRGGRNQELALSFASASPEGSQRVLLALATDGVDGDSDHAGAIVDAHTVLRGEALGSSAREALRRHDAGSFLHRAGDALQTGRTGVNVSDITIVLR
ncbi:MAG: DUF4147 domain-containing protein [Polyangiaceae bacterium]